MITSARRIARPARQPVPLARAAKRALDISIALPMLIVTAPLLLAAAFAVLFIDRRNPFFADDRIGFGGRRFRCLKLQTMCGNRQVLEAYFERFPEERDSYEATRKLRSDPRISRLGALLRKSSIDELPQLINVLSGDMSIVGPRPLAPREWERRGNSRFALTLVRPGLTGLWQVRGRSNLSHRHRVRLDELYARRWTITLDLRILASTPAAVLTRKGAR